MDDAATHVMPERGARLARVELTVVAGPDAGRVVVVAERARLGTAPACEIQLTDRAVSRLHCELVPTATGLRIVDLDSRNGTFVDGLRARDVELLQPATLSVGATRIEARPSGGEPEELAASPTFGPLLGASAAMRRLFRLLARVAPTEATVLVLGETGTGKELVARAIHEASTRAKGPFVAVDCGAIAESLVESELFGHTRGAFSGAIADREGLFEEADGGTLFLDEIGELPIATQPKLLRALEAREARRVGSNTARPFDVRIVAATRQPLAARVNEGTFREDLYYRLAVVELHLPPLRARREDIPALAAHFHERFAGRRAPLPAGLLATLVARSWPGNVRELRNYVERHVSLGAFAEDADAPSAARPEDPLPALAGLPLKEARERWTRAFEATYVRDLLAQTGGNVTRAAELAGVTRRSLQRMMAELPALRPEREGR